MEVNRQKGEESKANNKKAFWKNPIFILITAILVIVIGTVFLLININPADQEINDNEEITSQEQEGSGSSKSVKLEARSFVPNTNIEIINKGDFIGFVDVWGGYSEKDSILIVLTTPGASSSNMEEVPDEALNYSTHRLTENSQEYFILLEQDDLNSENLENIIMENFLMLFYQVNIDHNVDNITVEEFVQEGLSILGENEHFVIE